MKSKGIVLILLVFLVGSSVSYRVNAKTDDAIRDLEPVEYNKLEFKQNTDYLHDEKKVEMKNTIPVKQLDIDFDGSKKLPERGRDISFLFQEAERGQKSTVAVKAIETGLFTTETQVKKVEVIRDIQEEQSKGTNFRTMVFLGLIAVGVIFLFTVLLPKIGNSPLEKRKPVDKKAT